MNILAGAENRERRNSTYVKSRNEAENKGRQQYLDNKENLPNLSRPISNPRSSNTHRNPP